MAKTRKQVEQKTVHVVARITFKQPERSRYVVYIVRSSNGVDQYQVTLVDGKATGCTCPARKPCYHMTGCEAYEPQFVAQIAEARERMAEEQEQLAEAAAVAPAILGEQFAQDLEQHIEETLSDVLVFMDMDGFYGLVLISGQPSQYLYITEIREQCPVHRVISLEELALFKQQEAEKYRAQYPDDFYFAA